MDLTTMPAADNLILGNFNCYFGEIGAGGLPTSLRHVGNVSNLTVTPEVEVLEKDERMTSARGLYKRVVRKTKVTIKFTLDEITMENLQLGMLGTLVEFGQGSSTLTDFELTDDSKQGHYYRVGKRSLSSVVVKDDGTAATLTTDYTVDAARGLVYIVPGGGIVDGSTIAISATVAAVTAKTVRVGQDTNIERYVFLKGDPTTGATQDFEFWKVSLAPEGEFALITDEFATLQLTGAVQLDSTNHASDPFGRIIEHEAA